MLVKLFVDPRSTLLEMIHRDTNDEWDKGFKSIADDILRVKNEIIIPKKI